MRLECESRKSGKRNVNTSHLTRQESQCSWPRSEKGNSPLTTLGLFEPLKSGIILFVNSTTPATFVWKISIISSISVSSVFKNISTLSFFDRGVLTPALLTSTSIRPYFAESCETAEEIEEAEETSKSRPSTLTEELAPIRDSSLATAEDNASGFRPCRRGMHEVKDGKEVTRKMISKVLCKVTHLQE